MKNDKQYQYRTAEFAKLTGVTKRTLRHYDEIGLLKPRLRDEDNHRLYSVKEMDRMQRILSLKFMGFSITEIKEFLDQDYSIRESLKLQQKLMLKRISHMNRVIKAMKEIEISPKNSSEEDWAKIFNEIKAAQMEQYYSNRAKEYDEIYMRQDEIRQAEQKQMHEQIKLLFAGKRVLEIASGTGYWTQTIAEVADQVLATDLSEEMLAECKQRLKKCDNVEYAMMDAYKVDIGDNYDAGCANFWISHVPKARLEEFLGDFNRKLGSGAVVFMADNMYVEGLGGELVVKPAEKDTYKIRTLTSGETFEVLKNYYTEDQLKSIFGKHASDLHIHMGQCFWWLWYAVK